jgi:chemotaxis protein CheD
MVHVVGVGEMRLSCDSGDIIVTHPVGSCVGISIHDPESHVGGILHFMLPSSAVDPEKAAENPYLFADTGLQAFLREASAMGAERGRTRVVLVGGAQTADEAGHFAIGRRNQIAARKLLWREELVIGSEHLGGNLPRTFCLEVGSGRTWVKCNGTETDL